MKQYCWILELKSNDELNIFEKINKGGHNKEKKN